MRCLGIAVQKLNKGDEAGVQKALGASGLLWLSSDGTALARTDAGALEITPLDLPWVAGPRRWRAEIIAAHVPLYEEYAVEAGLLLRAGPSRRITKTTSSHRQKSNKNNTNAKAAPGCKVPPRLCLDQGILEPLLTSKSQSCHSPIDYFKSKETLCLRCACLFQ